MVRGAGPSLYAKEVEDSKAGGAAGPDRVRGFDAEEADEAGEGVGTGGEEESSDLGKVLSGGAAGGLDVGSEYRVF